jgi:hypothetical protein
MVTGKEKSWEFCCLIRCLLYGGAIVFCPINLVIFFLIFSDSVLDRGYWKVQGVVQVQLEAAHIFEVAVTCHISNWEQSSFRNFGSTELHFILELPCYKNFHRFVQNVHRSVLTLLPEDKKSISWFSSLLPFCSFPLIFSHCLGARLSFSPQLSQSDNHYYPYKYTRFSFSLQK